MANPPNHRKVFFMKNTITGTVLLLTLLCSTPLFASNSLPGKSHSIIYEIQLGAMGSSLTAPKTTTGKSVMDKIQDPRFMTYLKSLGINVIEIMPITGGLSNASSTNWGYTPFNFQAIDSAYTTGDQTPPDTQLKNMTDYFHKNGIKVMLDVVYNHGYHLPGNDYSGHSPYGTGWVNIFPGSDAALTINKDLMHWVGDGIDGFRFDLMHVFPYTVTDAWFNNPATLNKHYEQMNPGQSLIIFGEPWDMNMGKNDDAYISETGSLSQHSPKVGIFTGAFKSAMLGSNFYDPPNIHTTDNGFIYGNGDSTNVERGMVGDISGQIGTLSGGSDNGIVSSPLQFVDYISNHDDLDLYDHILASGLQNAVNIDKLAISIILTSNGLPYFFQNDPLGNDSYSQPLGPAKSKHNSYSHIDELPFDWDKVTQIEKDAQSKTPTSVGGQLFRYYSHLIAYRNNHSAIFESESADEIRNNSWFINPTGSTQQSIVRLWKKPTTAPASETWQAVVALYNSNTSTPMNIAFSDLSSAIQEHMTPASKHFNNPHYWHVIVENNTVTENEKDSTAVCTTTGCRVSVPPSSMTLMYFDGTKATTNTGPSGEKLTITTTPPTQFPEDTQRGLDANMSWTISSTKRGIELSSLKTTATMNGWTPAYSPGNQPYLHCNQTHGDGKTIQCHVTFRFLTHRTQYPFTITASDHSNIATASIGTVTTP